MRQHNFEGWANGAAISTGGIGSGDPFDFVTIDTANATVLATVTATTAQHAHGAVGVHINPNSVNLLDDEYGTPAADGQSSSLFGANGGNEKIAQSFTGIVGTVRAAIIDLNSVGSPTDNVTLQICADAAGIPNTTALASSTIAASSVPAGDTQGKTVLFTLGSDVTLVAANTYWIVLSRSGARSTVNYTNWSRRSDAYPGTRLVMANGTWATQASQDYKFRLLKPDTSPSFVGWNFTQSDERWARAYYRHAGVPPQGFKLISFWNGTNFSDSTGQCVTVIVTSAGQLRGQMNASATNVGTASSALTSGQWYRVECHMKQTTGVIDIWVWTGATLESNNTADCIYTQNLSAQAVTLQPDNVRFGITTHPTPFATNYTWDLDTVAESATGRIGPFSNSAAASSAIMAA